MKATIRVKLPDGSERDVPVGTTVLEAAASIGPRLARDTVAGLVNGQLVDLRTPLGQDAELRIVTGKDPEGGEVIRHSAEHVLAEAVKRLWPGTPIDAGRQDHTEKYQYDFRFPRPFTPEDFPRIEEEMRRIIAEDVAFERIETDREAAQAVMRERGEDLKLVRLADIPEGETITLYRSGGFVDLCRGPHVQRTSQIGAVRLLESSGAYFKGDERNEMLQRIYGTAFASQQELDAYFARLEEARRRDHRRIGRELDLFSFHAEAPASPFFHPRGAVVYNALIDLMREKYRHYGYEEVITPQIFSADLWRRSGHWDNYRDDMFYADGYELAGERTSSVKPMNCPSHCVLYGTRAHSYRDLPRRIADFGRLHRYERSGVVTGLTRVRSFSQDDAHIFCTPEQIEAEVTSLFDFIFEVYGLFGFGNVAVKLATRPAKAIGEEAVWRHAERVLAACLDARDEVDYTLNPGEGAFYGPKIDFDVLDAIGRSWQLATIQLDFNLPERFDLSYVDSAGVSRRPVMIHRAILGSLERFFGVMLEHFAGDLPPWLAPEQARVLPITDAVVGYAESVAQELRQRGLRVDVDRRSEKLGYKIRDGETMKVPYLLVVGQREADERTVSLRLRHRRDEGVQPLAAVVERIAGAARARSLTL
ncbi:MAG TPA: threonine--tRNA ligase [Thermoanaerobaculales bacterium]|nr:threonine--tRNA ligase [Thermoanaerobaculales bacterium]HPA79707.1 threonine--tRNA ligase [Thermoanaerobaculales bacterium]HQL28658.1 threonine--tRNA ligase [Thermoanaerobaculales bacterium]